jgi:chemosensory pili system protein ChpA (sensor histidine kinase/response regulator)
MTGRISNSPVAAPPLTESAHALVPPSPIHAEEPSDDIDAVDSLDPDLFPIFEEEALELLPQLGGALRQWVDRPDALDARGLVLRALHTLKGSSRLAGALRLGEMAHRFESEIETLGLEVDSGAQIAPLLSRLDSIESAFDNLRSRGLQSSLPVAFAAIPSVPEAAISETREAPAPAAAETPIARTGAIALPAPLVLAGARSASTQAVRVRASILDRLVNQAGEVMITRSRIESELGQLRTAMLDLTGNLDRLRQQLRDIELQAETQMQSRLAQAKDSQQNFDPLEFDRFTRVQELTRMMAESVNDVATVQRNIQRAVEATEDDLVAQSRQTRELQRDLLRTRMVEFDGISERLYRVVRQASKDLGKQVKLDVVGGSIEMDRGVLERMTPAFEHLLRNCVVHGVEAPEVRQSRGKDVVGTIVIELQQSGNDVAVEFRDDGGGLDLVRLREKAVANGLVSSGQTLSDSEAANLVFMPGITTAGEVTELAGRGIGMDVVRSEVQSLGGRIETQTRAGLGASFRLILPLTTAVTQVVMMRTGAHSIGVPANVVELVRRVTPAELALAYESGIFDFAGERVPFFWSGALLQTSARSVEVPGRTLPVVIFRSASQRVAVHVDEVLGNQEVVVKNLGSQLARLPGLAGMTVLPSGAVVLIYNPVALATVYGEQARQLSVAALEAERTDSGVESEVLIPTAPVVQQVPLVLVVDDSITVRRVTQRLLQREGYRVALAADGLQALERLQDEKPAIVLSDIEMPRMDGFDLVRNIRADARLRELPVVMITSRIAEKHREHARELGVDHYLGKPYSEDELLALVQRYTAVPVLQ